MVNLLATRVPSSCAGAPFYGAAPPLDQVAAIKAELLLVFADNDERINAMWPPYEAALKAAGVKLRGRTSTRARSTASTTTPRRASTRRGEGGVGPDLGVVQSHPAG